MPLLRTRSRSRLGIFRDDLLIGPCRARLRLRCITVLTAFSQASADATDRFTPLLAGCRVKVYRRLWWSVVVVLGAVGAVEAVLVVAPLLVWAAAATAAVLAGVGWIAYPKRRNLLSNHGLSVAQVASAGALVGIVVAGLATLLGGAALTALTVLALFHPRVLSRAAAQAVRWLPPIGPHRSSAPGPGLVPPPLRSASDSVRGAGASSRPGAWASKVVPRTPPADRGWPDLAAIRLLSTAQLCWDWRVSFTALERSDPQGDRRRWAALVEVRQRYLDEIARRDPAGFARWLYSGARPASDPSRYLIPPPLPRSAGRSGTNARALSRGTSSDPEGTHA